MLLMTSTLMVFLKHPISMGFIILIHTIYTCLMMGMISTNFWFSYILILIMIGGLLVLFIYMTSIASNEKFKFNKFLMLTLIMTFIIMMLVKIMENYYLNNLNNELMNNFFMNYNFNLNLSKFLNFPNSNIFILIIFYLLISMIAIVKITKFNFGPLRQFKYENTFTKK
uniref:NADH-ubiquinone oxidoreductase chain 6 n=1 Tax=Calvia decemguttata TaxID=1587120 RepID=A0A343C2C3_9CUCU|nr:NADH dehydrogenase subunit 6 [Calvia decemguttata]